MRVEIKCDPTACLRAGIEPASHMDIDLATLDDAQRGAIASIMCGLVVVEPVATPTIEALLAAAAKVAERARAEAAAKAATRVADEARVAEMRATLAAGPVVTAHVVDTLPSGYPFSWARVGYPYMSTYAVPDDLRLAIGQAQTEVEARNRAALGDSAAAAETRRVVGIEARAAASPLIAPDGTLAATELCPVKLAGTNLGSLSILSDDGHTLVLHGPSESYAPFERRMTVMLRTGRVDVTVALPGEAEAFEPMVYDIEDGVLKIPEATWAAVVVHPEEVKPVYEFIDRVPGGFAACRLAPRDVLVWGSRDRKGRKRGPYDRLVVRVEESKVRTVRCTYVDARRLRRSMP